MGKQITFRLPIKSGPAAARFARYWSMMGSMSEREVIIQWLRECGYEHEQTGKLSRIALGKTFAKIALAIERGEHLNLARGE